MTEAGRHRRWLFSLSILVASCAFGDVAIAQTNETGDLSFELVDPKVLRVCSDPRNLPFSNEKLEGFENKLAELFAKKLDKSLAYTWFPQATGFVRQTLAKLTELGWRVVNLDVTVFAEEPKLRGVKTAIRANLAALLGVLPEAVNVKAKTGEGVGHIGRAEAIGCHAVVLIEKKEESSPR